MKKYLTIAMIALLGLALTACGGNDNGNGDLGGGDYIQSLYPDNDYYFDDDFDFDLDFGFGGGGEWFDPTGNPDPALSSLMDQLLYNVPWGDWELPMSETWELTADNFYNVLFIDYIEGAKGVMSQALIAVHPHAVVLVELPDGVDASAVAAQIEANADPARWICVAAEKLGVFTVGQFVVMAMSEANTVDGIESNLDVLR